MKCDNCDKEAKVLRKKLGIKGWLCDACFNNVSCLNYSENSHHNTPNSNEVR